MILGVLTIFVAGILLINYFANKNVGSSPTIEIGDETAGNTVTHVVAEGETLGSISEKYYGTSGNWVDLVRENNIEDANNIEAGQILIIPEISPKIASQVTSPTPIVTDVTSTAETSTPAPTSEPTTLSTSTPTPTVFTESGQGAVSTEAKTHFVEKGETLWSIAEKYYGSGYNWVDISESNKLANSNLIEEGKELFIPNVESKVSTTSLVEPDKAINGESYTVEKGDNLWNIAVRAYGDGYKWVEISRENNLQNPNLIFAGNTLSLPR